MGVEYLTPGQGWFILSPSSHRWTSSAFDPTCRWLFDSAKTRSVQPVKRAFLSEEPGPGRNILHALCPESDIQNADFASQGSTDQSSIPENTLTSPSCRPFFKLGTARTYHAIIWKIVPLYRRCWRFDALYLNAINVQRPHGQSSDPQHRYAPVCICSHCTEPMY